MEALGRLLDVSTGWTIRDQSAGAVTGARVSMKNCTGVMVLISVESAAATGTTDLVFTLREHSVSSGGSSQDLDVVDHYYIKSEATLDGDETWTRVAQTAGDITLAGTTYEDRDLILAFEVGAAQLSAGFDYISVNAADYGSVTRYGECLYILHDLAHQRKPANLVAPLS